MQRLLLVPAFGLALAFAQFRESGLPGLAGHLEIVTGMPARVYLFEDGRPFRLSPVDALLPLRVDLFYRERLWRRTADPKTLEITCNEQSHFVLLAGSGAFDLPPGNYRVEAYRGTFYRPASRSHRSRTESGRSARTFRVSSIAFSTGCAQRKWSWSLTCTARATSQHGVTSRAGVLATPHPSVAARETS